MTGVTDQHDIPARLGMSRYFDMNFRHQRTRCVKHPQMPCGGLFAHRLGNAMRAENNGGTVGHFVEFVDEHGAARPKSVDDETIVYDFVTHIDRRTERFQRALDDLDRAVDAGAESTGVGEYDFHDGYSTATSV